MQMIHARSNSQRGAAGSLSGMQPPPSILIPSTPPAPVAHTQSARAAGSHPPPEGSAQALQCATHMQAGVSAAPAAGGRLAAWQWGC